MKRFASQCIAVTLAATMLAGCTEPNGAPGRGIENGGALDKQDVSTALGAVGGGLIGSAIGAGTGNVVAIIGGVLLGGILGNQIGKSMDNADRAAYDRASQRAMEEGRMESWRNPHTGHYGRIRPMREFTDASGRRCRHYTQAIYIHGERHEGEGTACREPNGMWRIVNE